MAKLSSKEESKAKVFQLVRHDGLTMSEAAEEVGVSRQTVHAWLRKAYPGEYEKINYTEKTNLVETWILAYAYKNNLTDSEMALSQAVNQMNAIINKNYNSSKFGLFRRGERPLPDAVRCFMLEYSIEYALLKALNIHSTQAQSQLFLQMISSPEIVTEKNHSKFINLIESWLLAYFEKNKNQHDESNQKKLAFIATNEMNSLLGTAYNAYKIGVFRKKERPLPEIARVYMQSYVIAYVTFEVFSSRFDKSQIEILSNMIATP